MSSFIQFELWKDCKQCCPFCCNRGQVPINKKESCEYVMEKLDTLTTKSYNYIGFIGGEFFNGELEGYLEQFTAIINKANELQPRKIFITSSLIFDAEKYLFPFLKSIPFRNKIVICTSWDAKYRFHTITQQLQWAKNMLLLKNKFPEVELHVEIILMQPFIDAVNNELISLKLFRDIFKCSVDFIEPSSGLYFKDKYECQEAIPGFFPTKKSFVQFLKNVKNDVDLNKLLSMDLRSEELYFIENGNRRVAKNRREGDGRCELSDKTKQYDIGFIDSNDPMRKIVLQFKETLGEE